MKKLTKHIFIFLFSVLFVWNGAGANYVVFHCFNCQKEQVEEHTHGCCDEKSCSDAAATDDARCCGENHHPFSKDLNTNHGHHNGHCVYIIEYKSDIQNNVSEISIPSIELLKSDLFSLFIPYKNENKSSFHTLFVPPPRSINTLLSTICVFLI